MWENGWRDQVWGELNRQWDIIIVGGGITGAGIFREATRAGFRTLLLEGQDFSSGTSSRSSKLVHGGLRYLRHGQLKTTLASVHERERLLDEGKGLIRPLAFLYASYSGDKMPLWMLGAGLALYDLFSLHWGHKRYDPHGLARLTPDLSQSELRGGYRYWDAQTDDARLVLRVIQEGVNAGGVALNYARAEGLLQRANGSVCGVKARDVAGECQARATEVEAKIVVNATGADADRLRSQLDMGARLRRLRGSHLIFPISVFPLKRAVSFSHPVDGRPVFALPWEGVTLFGTTDVDDKNEAPVEPKISKAELDYLMAAVTYAFPLLEINEGDVQATFSGIRSVVDSGKKNPSQESREHVIWSESGLLTVSGGKLTTFRMMALDALRKLGVRPTRNQRIKHRPVLDPVELPHESSGLEPCLRQRLLGRYGRDAWSLITTAAPGELTPVDEALGNRVLWAELRWAARAEGIVHLEDLLLRRVRLGLLLPQGAIPWLAQIRHVVLPELGWDDQRWDVEARAYANQWRQNYSLPSPAKRHLVEAA